MRTGAADAVIDAVACFVAALAAVAVATLLIVVVPFDSGEFTATV